MTLLGLPFLWWALLGSFSLAAVISLAWVAAMDRHNPPRDRGEHSIPVARALPLNISIPTRHRALVEARKNGKL